MNSGHHITLGKRQMLKKNLVLFDPKTSKERMIVAISALLL